MYKLIIPNAVAKDLKKLPLEVQKRIIKDHLPSIQSKPQQGAFLREKFRRFRKYSFSYHKTEYRIIYKIAEANKLVVLIMLGSRANFYEKLKHRI